MEIQSAKLIITVVDEDGVTELVTEIVEVTDKKEDTTAESTTKKQSNDPSEWTKEEVVESVEEVEEIVYEVPEEIIEEAEKEIELLQEQIHLRSEIRSSMFEDVDSGINTQQQALDEKKQEFENYLNSLETIQKHTIETTKVLEKSFNEDIQNIQLKILAIDNNTLIVDLPEKFIL